VAGGLGRALVFVNYPTALVAIAVVAIAADRLPRSSPVAATSLAAIVLCLLVVVPGVVDQDDLDAKPVNALPAVGVALALGLAGAAAGRAERIRPGRLAGDRLRIAAAAALAMLAVPWLFAETGFYGPDPILADEVPPGETIPAVHLGHHHGTDGVLLGLTALALSRTLTRFGSKRLARLASAYLALMLAYGIANALQDGWLEQVVKRGWTDAEIPGVLRPELTVSWGVIVLAAIAVETAWFRRERRRGSPF
jgi:hypothetical protein